MTGPITLKVSYRVRLPWLLMALNYIPCKLGFEPFVPSWFVVVKVGH